MPPKLDPDVLKRYLTPLRQNPTKSAASPMINPEEPTIVRKYLDYTDQVYLNFLSRQPQNSNEALIFGLKRQEVEVHKQKIVAKSEELVRVKGGLRNGRELSVVYDSLVVELKKEISAYKAWMRRMVEGFMLLYGDKAC
ncbi:hypothetical protein HYALB_00007113 [Hymenoscyphus albidus]|uniref:Uncharacterized protein n=1 Tax=Hymenoscyphus albidus TaxID=595503 RepID=A0A9N9M1M3_9HELO|nr:hypothetical protein HYALB_00007113 [Hymenoscyphus albidus]